MDREVIRCKTCGLVQYRTRTGNCRRCVRALPQRLEFLIPPAAPVEEAAAEVASDRFINQETVENIGQRIRQLRESRAMTQSQLQSRSKVSRSYLSRIESGQMTPSLGTLEKISEALNVGLNRFFIPESDGEALLEDPFIQGLRPFLRQLDWEQWQSILKRLQAISDHVAAIPATLRPIGNPARLPQQQASANGNGNGKRQRQRQRSYRDRPFEWTRAHSCSRQSAGLSDASPWCAGLSALACQDVNAYFETQFFNAKRDKRNGLSRFSLLGPFEVRWPILALFARVGLLLADYRNFRAGRLPAA